MPELPDVEAARRLVERTATGARIDTVVCPDPSALRNTTVRRFRHAVVGEHVRSAARRGKWLAISTDGASIVVHLGMTGALRWSSRDDRGEPHVETDDSRFCRLALVAGRGALRFVDRRKLGGVWLAADDAELRHVLDDLGPDALGLPCDELLAILERVQEAAQGRPHGPVAPGRPREHAQRRDPLAGPTPPDPCRRHPRPRRGEAAVRRRPDRTGGIGSCRTHPPHAVVALRSAGRRRSDLPTVRHRASMVHGQQPIGPVVPAMPAASPNAMSRVHAGSKAGTDGSIAVGVGNVGGSSRLEEPWASYCG